MTEADSFERDVRIYRNGVGYVLQVGGEEHRVTPAETMGLFTSLLHSMPEIPDGVRTAHHIRCGPRLVIRLGWRSVGGVLLQDCFYPIITVSGAVVHRGPSYPSLALAIQDASEAYGTDLEVDRTEDLPGSLKAERAKALSWVVEDYAEGRGMSTGELMKLFATEGVPDELRPKLKIKEVPHVA